MSLKKKIILSFLLSSTIIAVLAFSSSLNFVEMRKEIRYLELSDTLRSKTLQLRRHEKNFFLYRDLSEIENVYSYLKEIKGIIRESRPHYDNAQLSSLDDKTIEYETRFNRIEIIIWNFQKELSAIKPRYPQYKSIFPLIESTFLERPLVNAELLQNTFALGPESTTIQNLIELSNEIKILRKDGEEILTLSKDLDRSAREKVENAISLSEAAVVVLFPLSFLVGLGGLFFISHSVVKRLKILTTALRRTGEGSFATLSIPEGQDEVGSLIASFNKMEEDLINRESELEKKNNELFQSKKLASIGTLASGVAHELNNPLNNIYLAAQILSREIDQESCAGVIKESIGDIYSETLRVKRIVGELLEFARERPPDLKKMEIVSFLNTILDQMKSSGELADVHYEIDSPEVVELDADTHLLQQVFINLFSNAVDAMDQCGMLLIAVKPGSNKVVIKISDTGKGILPTNISRVFDPFFTTKEKGTGLGLAVVYSIIKKHKGKIEVESEQFKGTTFIITLPRSQ